VSGLACARRIVPAGIGLVLFLTLATLWLTGAQQSYMGFFRLLGLDPFAFPFLDTHAVLSAIECHRRGIDVYAANPCDALGRFHVYSPLWLHLSALPIDTTWTNTLGLTLDLGFLASLTLLPPPARPSGIVILAAAVVSPASIFALERGNNDLLIFILATLTGCLILRSQWTRLLGYACIVVAAALKFYPVTLLVLAWRERWPRCLIVVALSIAALAACLLPEKADLLRALPLVPTGKIGAMSLPIGFAEGMDWPPWSRFVIYGLLLLIAIPRAIRWARDVQPELRRLPEAERVFLTIGAALMVGCFFAGQSVGYRAIHLLFVLPALLTLSAAPGFRLARTGVGLILWVMWGYMLRTQPGRLDDLLRLIEQCAWWALVTILSATLLALLRSSPAWQSLWLRPDTSRHPA
jgi:hypothetical protein